MNRRYIREAAVVGLYQYFLNLDANIDIFEEQVKEKSLITRQILQNHKRKYDLSHYKDILPKEEPIEKDPDDDTLSEKDFLQQFIDSYNESFENLKNHLTKLNEQIRTDIVIFIQLLYKLRTIFHLEVHEEIDKWISRIDEGLIVNLMVSYKDFWEDKNDDIDQIRKHIFRNIEKIESINDFVSQIFISANFSEYLASLDIEWENNLAIVKKRIFNDELFNILDEDKDFDSYNDFYLSLVNATIDNLETISEKIKENTLNWDFERISLLDKSILAMAIGEFFYADHLPKQIVINEYLEISKKISRIDSSTFINGILDKTLN